MVTTDAPPMRVSVIVPVYNEEATVADLVRLVRTVPLNLEMKLEVWDSPNSAGIVIDVIRAVKLARERGLAGPLLAVSAFSMKHPPVQMRDELAARRIDEFVAGRGEA